MTFIEYLLNKVNEIRQALLNLNVSLWEEGGAGGEGL